jgi:tripartite-type tricarboxylate transporter receptor subunit TctC
MKRPAFAPPVAVRRLLRSLATGLALALIAGGAGAADSVAYPSRPVRIVVAYAAGTQMDAVARMVGARYSELAGQPVIVENRAGASGNIAADFVAKAPPDGHTLLVTGVNLTIQPSTAGARAVDPVRALVPVTKLVTQPIVILAYPMLGADSLADVIQLARKEPEHLSFTTGGVGTSPHLCAEMLATQAGVRMTHVPYANALQGVRDVIAGMVPLNFTVLSAGMPFIRSGQLKPVAVTSLRRVGAFPNLPTVSESGFPGFESSSWYGLLAPAGTPAEIVERLQRDVAGILAQAEIRDKLVGMGVEIIGNRPEQFAAEIRAEVSQWPRIVKAAGIVQE